MAAPLLDGMTDVRGLVFADDTTLVAEGRDPATAASKLNCALELLTALLRTRRQEVNAHKTMAIVF